MTGGRTTLCVYCSSSQRIAPAFVALASAVGSAIGERGWELVSGGGSVSMMGALATAARAAGARTTGIIPRALLDQEVADHAADELLVTADMRERKGLMDARADAFLTLPGGIGTLEELLEIWVARSLGMHAKPVVVLDPDGTFALLRQQVEQLAQEGFVRSDALTSVHWVSTVDDAFATLERELAIPTATHPAPVDELLEAQP